MPERISGNRPATLPTPIASTAGSVTVRAGDSLSGIARANGTTVDALVQANVAKYPTLATNPGGIQVGWQLKLAGGSPATPPATGPAQWKPKSNDQVVLLGMNKSSDFEVAEMKKRGVNVTHVKDTAENDKITVGGRSYDLSTEDGAKQFAVTLGLPADQTLKIASAISSAGDDAKDEMAQIAQIWAKAESGGQIPSRMMLSGHNVGSGVWGDDNGKVSFEALGKLAEAMPRAARSVEDLHLAACYSGGESLMDKYKAMFPNVQTIWAYSGSAPGSYSGATAHQSRWESATRGDKDTLSRDIAAATRKGENVAVWSKQGGYVDGRPPTPIDEVRSEVTRSQQEFTDAFSGKAPVTDNQAGPLRQHYNQLQRLIQHPQLPAAERTVLESQRDQTIRLLFFTSNVAPKFQAANERQINAGYQALGLPAPNFSRLSRADALAQVASFEARLASTNPAPAAARALLPVLTDGLRDLKAQHVPETWI